MKLSTNILAFFTAAGIAVVASSCFTGVESTPKITADNVRESGVRVTDEQSFARQIISEPPARWLPGKKWLVADQKIALTFTPASSPTDSLTGHTLAFVEARTAPTLTGAEAVELVLRSDDNRTFYHRTGVAPQDWELRSGYSLPFAIELSAVELADKLMAGKTFFISTPRWYDKEGRDVNGQRHVPVTVVGVRPGNHLYPLLVGFTQPMRPEQPVMYVLMTYGSETSATRNFDRLFSFSDPRKDYPSITDETWQKIINSQLAEGMTRDECRLALGTPAAVDRAATPGAMLERWSYENGVYLIFEDGYLTKYRQ